MHAESFRKPQSSFIQLFPSDLSKATNDFSTSDINRQMIQAHSNQFKDEPKASIRLLKTLVLNNEKLLNFLWDKIPIMSEDIITLANEIESFRTKLSNIEAQNSEIKTKISNIEAQNSEMNTYFLTLLDQSLFISQSANSLVEDLDSLHTKILNIETQNSEMNTKISKIENAFGTFAKAFNDFLKLYRANFPEVKEFQILVDQKE